MPVYIFACTSFGCVEASVPLGYSGVRASDTRQKPSALTAELCGVQSHGVLFRKAASLGGKPNHTLTLSSSILKKRCLFGP